MKERKTIIPNENPKLYIISKWEEVGENGEKSAGVSKFPILAWEIDSKEGAYDFDYPEPISLWGKWNDYAMSSGNDAIYDANIERWWRVGGEEFGIGIQDFMDRTVVK